MAQSNGLASLEGEYSHNDFLCRVGPKTPMGAALWRTSRCPTATRSTSGFLGVTMSHLETRWESWAS
jgi:hypothetical protein